MFYDFNSVELLYFTFIPWYTTSLFWWFHVTYYRNKTNSIIVGNIFKLFDRLGIDKVTIYDKLIKENDFILLQLQRLFFSIIEIKKFLLIIILKSV